MVDADRPLGVPAKSTGMTTAVERSRIDCEDDCEELGKAANSGSG
jgi:hypothetical protein